MSSSLKFVHETAVRTRTDFEQGNVNIPHLLRVGEEYFPAAVNNWKRSAHKALGVFPLFSCELATGLLRHRIGFGEVVEGRYDINSHAFLNLGAIGSEADSEPDFKTITDITADQFGGPAVYVGALVEPWGTKEDIADLHARMFRSLVQIKLD